MTQKHTKIHDVVWVRETSSPEIFYFIDLGPSANRLNNVKI